MDGQAVTNIASLAINQKVPEIRGNTALPVSPFILRNGENGSAVVEYLKTLDKPSCLAQRVSFDDVGSLIAYVNQFKTTDTRLFVNLAESGTFTAVMDYHSNHQHPQFCKHVALLPLKQTPEFAAWRGISGKAIGQQEFANFLEDNLSAVVRPAAAELLEVALTLEAKKSVTFKKGIRLDNGDTNLTFLNTTDGTAGERGDLSIPSKIELNVALFEGAEPTAVVCRFRYRISDNGTLTFTVIIEQLERLVRASIDAVAMQIKRDTGIEVWKGSPTLAT